MKTLLTIILLFILTIPVFADSKLSALSANGSPAGTDLTYDVASGTSYKITLAQVAAYVLTANVGIGSANPGQALDVAGTVRAGSFMTPTGTSSQFFKANGTIDSTAYGTGTVTSIATTSPITGGTITGSGTIGINTTGPWNGYAAGMTGVAPIVFTSSNGNIGINTTGTWNGNSATVQTINGLITQGSNVTITGSGTSGSPYNISSSGGGGSALWVTGNVGINTTNNVGIGSTNPGSILDVQGTIRTTGLQLNLSPLAGGNVLVSNSVGLGTWMPATTIPTSLTLTTTGSSGASTLTGNVLNVPQYTGGGGSSQWLTNSGTVGINTTQAVGIGTNSIVNSLNILGNVGIGTFSYDPFMTTAAPSGGLIMAGNLGVGTINPGYAIDTNGGGRFLGTGTSYFGSNVGVGSISPADTLSVVGGIQLAGNFAGGTTGNVGIGTTQTAAGATCDSSCNTANMRCFFGIVTATSNIEPCSKSIIGDCLCLPAT